MYFCPVKTKCEEGERRKKRNVPAGAECVCVPERQMLSFVNTPDVVGSASSSASTRSVTAALPMPMSTDTNAKVCDALVDCREQVWREWLGFRSRKMEEKDDVLNIKSVKIEFHTGQFYPEKN